MNFVCGDLLVHENYSQWMRYTPEEKINELCPEQTARRFVVPGDMMLVISVDQTTGFLLVLCKNGYGWLHSAGQQRV